MKLTIVQKILMVFLAMTTIIIVAGTVWKTKVEYDMFQEGLDERVKMLINNISNNVSYFVLIGDRTNIERIAGNAFDQKDIVFCRLTDRQGKVLFEKAKGEYKNIKKYRVSITAEISKKSEEGDDLLFGSGERTKENIGEILLEVSLTSYIERVKENNIENIIVGVSVGSIMFIILYFLLKIIIIKHLVDFVGGIEKVSEGKFDYRIPVKNRDEMSKVSRAFNNMAQNLQNSVVSKDFLDSVIQNMAEGVIVADVDGRITIINKAVIDLLKYTNEEILGRDIFSVITPDLSIDNINLTNARSMRHTEIELCRKNKSSVLASVSCTPLTDSTGSTGGFVFLVEDLTERKKMEKEREDAKKRFEDIVYSMGDWIWEVDDKGIYTYCSEKVKNVLGYNTEEIMGKTPFDFMSPEEVGKIRMVFAEIINKRGHISDLENWNITKEGKRVCLLTNGVPIFDNEGELKGYRGVDRDITDRKMLEDEKEKLQNNMLQSEKMAAVGKLASGVAHEINNPLTVILGYTQLLIKKTAEEGVSLRQLKAIEKETVRCKILVEELLLFSRMQKTTFDKIDLNKTVEEIIQIVQTKSKVSDVKLITEFDSSVGPLMGSKNQIQQVVANLCNNAIDAVSSGGKVWIRTKHFKEYALLEVEDNGVGIPEDIKNQIFEPFFTTKEVGKGTGLGLSLTFEILKKHGFEISLESEVKKGSKFIVKMPYKDFNFNP